MLSKLIDTGESSVAIASIRTDGGTQPREGLDAKYIDDLVEALTNGATLPPVDLMYDGDCYWLYDGFHRLAAHKAVNRVFIAARVHQGDQAAAQWESYAANQAHGLRRSQADKERAIRAALKHPQGAKLADNLIAKHLGVSDKTVKRYREIMEASSEIPKMEERTVQRGGQTYTQNTANIGANRPAAQSPSRRYESGLPSLDMPASRPAIDAQPEIPNRDRDLVPTTAQSSSADDAETPDPWVAAWARRQYDDSLTDRCQRLAVAMLEWGQAWTDDKGRSWIDVIDRNPWHANSPFRQAAVAECKRRGVAVVDEGMAETIRRLFGLLMESDNLLLSDGGEQASGVTDHESGGRRQGEETLTAADMQVMQSAPAAEEWEVDGDRPLPAWVSAWADGDPAAGVGTKNAEDDSHAEEQVPVSQREGYDSDEWYTPGWVIEAARRVMGEIDLDPASCELAQEVVGAGLYWTKRQDGCRTAWWGRVWLNPPYSAPGAFVEKLIEEYTHGNVKQAVVLLNNSTETRWFQRLLMRFPVCFFNQRLAFWRHDHAEVGARQGQAVFYLGSEVDRFVSEFGKFGIVVRRVD